MARKKRSKAAVSSSSIDPRLHFRKPQTVEQPVDQRWPREIPKDMTFMLRLDPGSPIIGDKTPKPTRYESLGAPVTCEHSFQIELPPQEPSEKDSEEESSQSGTGEDVCDSPDPSTPDDSSFEHYVPFPGMIFDPNNLYPWMAGNQTEAMMFLNSVPCLYPPFLPEYPLDQSMLPGSFAFQESLANLPVQHSFLGDPGLPCSLSFSNSVTLERQHPASNATDPASFDPAEGNLLSFRLDQATAPNSCSASSRHETERNELAGRTSHNRSRTASTDACNQLQARDSRDGEVETNESSGGGADCQPQPKKRRRTIPGGVDMQPSHHPFLPALPSLPSIFPPDWYGSNIIQGRSAYDHSRHSVPLRPAPPPAETALSSLSHSAYSGNVSHLHLQVPCSSAPPDRPCAQATLPTPTGSVTADTTLRPAIWSFPPLFPLHPDPRTGVAPQHHLPAIAQGPAYLPPPGIGHFGFMGPVFPFPPPRGESWTEHFDILQDELQERRRLQKIQDRFNMMNSIPRKPPKRRSLYYPCPLCDRSFLRRNSLALHIKWHYQPREELDAGAMDFVFKEVVIPGTDSIFENFQESRELDLSSPQDGLISSNTAGDVSERTNVRNSSSLLSATQQEVACPITPLATPPGTPLIRISKRPVDALEASGGSRLRSDTVTSEKSIAWSLFGSPVQDRSP